MEECQGIVDRHIKYLNNNRVDVRPEYRCFAFVLLASKAS